MNFLMLALVIGIIAGLLSAIFSGAVIPLSMTVLYLITALYILGY